MKILFLCRHRFDNITGGVFEYLHYLPIALKALNIQSLGYTSGSKQFTGPRYLPNDMPTYEGPFLKPRLFTFTGKLKPLFDFCLREKIDLVHAQNIYRSGFMALQIYKHTNIPYILTSHSDILPTNSQRIQRKKIQHRCQQILKHAAAVTHLTPIMQEASQQIYDTHDKNYIVGNGIDLAEWHTYTHLPEKNYMLAIGRLITGKGFDILIDAYAKLRKQGITTSLVIAGDGIERENLFTKVKQLGLNLVTNFQDVENIPEASVVFTGYIKGDAKKYLFAHSLLILFATQPRTWEEAFGIVLLEAMAAGKAIISSDIESTRYLQTLGLQTQLVEATNIDAWADEIKHLLENTTLRQQMSHQNLEQVQQFDWKNVAAEYQDVYTKTLKQSGLDA